MERVGRLSAGFSVHNGLELNGYRMDIRIRIKYTEKNYSEWHYKFTSHLKTAETISKFVCRSVRSKRTVHATIFTWHLFINTVCNNNRMPKIMLNYKPNGRRRIGRSLKRILDEVETGLSKLNSWWKMMMMMIRRRRMMMQYSSRKGCNKIKFHRWNYI